MTAPESWDLFCRVVDNYGDAGVAWRLARQLAVDPARRVRLFIDDPRTLARLEPRYPERDVVDGVAIAPLDADLAAVPADTVVELFGCRLPDLYLAAMAARPTPPVWIELEYLSAEAWVADFHGKPSPHPTLPLVRHYFYPGFDDATGGLLIEPDHGARSDRVPGDGRRAFVFCYPHAPVTALLEAMERDPSPWHVTVAEGIATDAVGRFRGTRTHLEVVPFVPQHDFDRLLLDSDLAFVRGEDSFVRAQLAGIPFVWHIYPQADDAHRVKLAAFEARWQAGWAPGMRAAATAFWDAWNGQGDLAAAWPAWRDAMPTMAAHAAAWRDGLLRRSGLVTRLAAFVAERRAERLK